MIKKLTKESCIATKDILIPEIHRLKEFYSRDVIEYLYSLIALESTGLEDETIRRFISDKKEFFKYFNYNFWYRTKYLIEDMDNKNIKFDDGVITVNRKHIASVYPIGYHTRTLSIVDDAELYDEEPFEALINCYSSDKSLEELKIEREKLLKELHELEQMIIIRRNEYTNSNAFCYTENFNKEHQRILKKLDLLDRKISSRNRDAELHDNPIYTEIANELLESFDSLDESKFTDEKGVLVKKHPHLTIRKIKY